MYMTQLEMRSDEILNLKREIESMRADNMVLRATPVTMPGPAGKAEKAEKNTVKVTEKPYQSALHTSPYADPPPKIPAAKSNKNTPDLKVKKGGA